MLKKARFARSPCLEKWTDTKDLGDKMSDKTGKSPSPQRKSPAVRKSPSSKSKSPSPTRGKKSPVVPPSALKTADKENDPAAGEKKAKRQTTVKSPDLTEKGLKIINYSGQGMTSVPASLITAKEIGELCLASNNLRSLPPEIKRLTTLCKLDVSKNGIRCSHPQDFGGLPAELAQLENLEEMKISECNLPYIPPAIWQLKNLKVLDVSRNKINILQPEIGNLTELQRLNLQQTNISSLPPEIAYCQELEEVLLWGNTIETLPETLPEMPKLKTLALNYRSFCGVVDNYMENLLRKGQIKSEHIPIVVFELPALEVLDLENTKINNLPDIYNVNLREFYLCKNFLQTIPSTVYGLKHLQVLDLSRNLLAALPEEIGHLQSLVTLRVNNNSFNRLPISVGQLQNLEELNMAGNKVKYLPNSIKGLKKLKRLIVEQNELTSLPDEICELMELETLDITENKVKNLPMKLHQLTKITVAHSYLKLNKHGLWLYKNPLVQPPPHIWKTENPGKIFDYLKKLAIIKTENLQRQKMLLLGESQSGKTSLTNALVHRKSMLTSGMDDKTRVLEQFPWRTDNAVEFLINDFGGDEAYRMTYPLFLDAKGLVLVVYDHSSYSVDKHQSAIGYWLHMLSVHSPGAVIKLVGTKCDLCPEEEDVAKTTELVNQQVQKQLDKYKSKLTLEKQNVEKLLQDAKKAADSQNSASDPLVKHLEMQQAKLSKLLSNPLKVLPNIATISSIEGLHGISDLIESVELLAIDRTLFPHAQRSIPGHWNKLRAMLKQQKSYYLLWEEVQQLAKPFEMKEEELQESLQYLHDIGEFLWFSNTPGLATLVFHKPRVLVDIIAALYRHDVEDFLNFSENKIFMSKGNFSETEFQATREAFLSNGHISRPLLNCLWFFQNLNHTTFVDLIDLLPLLDICYSIPEPDVPQGKNFCQPLVILPWYNSQMAENDLKEVWDDGKSPDHKTFVMDYEFPLGLPDGLFEQMSAALQEIVLSRIDWKDAIFAATENENLLISRSLETETGVANMKLSIRGPDSEGVQSLLGELTQTIGDLLLRFPGLVWKIKASPHLWSTHALYTKSLTPVNMVEGKGTVE